MENQSNYSFSQRFRLCRNSTRDSKQHFFTRLSVVLLFMGWLWICKIFDLLSFPTPQCIRDEFFKATQPINKFLAQNQTLLNFCILATSWSIDLFLLIFSFLFIFYYRSWRFVFWGFMFYPVRSIIQLFFGMKIPSSYIWQYPGLPSLFVPYSLGDFFYSGHVGLVLAVALELFNYKINWLAITALVFNFFNAFTLIVTRAHYSVDIVAGLLISHYFYIIAGYLSNYLDKKGFIWQRKILNDKQREQEERILQAGYRKPNKQLRHATGGFNSEDEESGFLVNNGQGGGSDLMLQNANNRQKLLITGFNTRNQSIEIQKQRQFKSADQSANKQSTGIQISSFQSQQKERRYC